MLIHLSYGPYQIQRFSFPCSSGSEGTVSPTRIDSVFVIYYPMKIPWDRPDSNLLSFKHLFYRPVQLSRVDAIPKKKPRVCRGLYIVISVKNLFTLYIFPLALIRCVPLKSNSIPCPILVLMSAFLFLSYKHEAVS